VARPLIPSLLFSCGDTVRMWDICGSSAACVRVICQHRAYATCVTGLTSHCAASADHDGVIKVVDVRGGCVMQSFQHDSIVFSLAVLPWGALAAGVGNVISLFI